MVLRHMKSLRAIEFTRFPISDEPGDHENEEGLIARAANLIGVAR